LAGLCPDCTPKSVSSQLVAKLDHPKKKGERNRKDQGVENPYQNGRFTCPDVAVDNSQPALIADGILTFDDALSVARGKVKEPGIRGSSEGIFFEIEIGSVHSDSGGRVNMGDTSPKPVKHTGPPVVKTQKTHLALALS